MANNTVILKMDKERNLKFGFNTLIDIEEDFGKPIAEIGNNISLKDVRTLLYHGLKWEDKKLTKEKTGDLITGYVEGGNTLESLMEAVGKAFTKALGNSATPTK